MLKNKFYSRFLSRNILLAVSAISLIGCSETVDVTNSDSGNVDTVSVSHLLNYWNQVTAADERILDNTENAALAIKIADNGRSKLDQMATDFSAGAVFTGRSLFNSDTSVNDVELRATFLDLQHLTVFVSLPSSSEFSNAEYKDPVIIAKIESALIYLLDNVYMLGSAHTGNWWNWEIGANASLMNIVSLLKEELSPELKAKAIKVSRYMSPDPRTIFDSEGTENSRVAEPSTGANRVDLVEINIVRASLDDKMCEINNAMESLFEIFEYVDSGDGFYKDGSVIQHVDIPYNGGYGSIILDGIARIQYVATNAGYVTAKKHHDFLYGIIFNNFEPVLFKSQVIEGVRGRGASRGWNRGRKEAQSVIQSLLMLYSVAPSEYKTKLGMLIKEQLLSPDADRPQYMINEFANMNVPLYIANNELLVDSSLAARGRLEGNFLLDNSDRVVHRKDDWLFSISAFSDRVGNYECINGENLKGYNTSNGMTYIYDADQEQYVNYWPMMNPILPAGTTGNVTDSPTDCSQILAGDSRKSTMKWVGGVSSRNKLDFDGSYGAFGMYFESFDDNVKINKSWFMFDNEVVALGSDLITTSASDTQTSVEFRKIQSNAINNIYIDDVLQTPGLTALNYSGQPDWIFVAGDKSVTSSRGYVFPYKQDVLLDRTILLAKDWNELNDSNDSRMTNTAVNYNTIDVKLEHRANDNYAYIILPTTTREKVKTYNMSPDVEIIENSTDLHWVKEEKLKLQAANVWKSDGVVRSDFVVDKPSSLMMREDIEGNITVWIASPVRSNNVVSLTLPMVTTAKSLSSLSDLSAITQVSNNEFTIDFSNLEGKTVMIHLENK